MPPSDTPPVTQIPVADEEAGPYGITAGPDGALWLTLVHGGRIARLTLDGKLDEFPLDSPTCRRMVIAHPYPAVLPGLRPVHGFPSPAGGLEDR